MIKDALGWLIEKWQELAIWYLDLVMNLLAILFDSIPVPDFLLNVQPFVFDGSLAWFLEPWNIEYIFASVGAAYVARFTLRRIPFIG